MAPSHLPRVNAPAIVGNYPLWPAVRVTDDLCCLCHGFRIFRIRNCPTDNLGRCPIRINNDPRAPDFTVGVYPLDASFHYVLHFTAAHLSLVRLLLT